MSEACPFEPLAFNVVVELDPVEEKTKGGIILLNEETERQKHGAEQGTLVAVSPLAFSSLGKDAPVAEVGVRVLINRHVGVLKEHDGKNYRIIEDKSVIALDRRA